MAQIFVINGPNLNLLGTREPQHYGNTTLSDIETRLHAIAEAFGHDLAFYQDNHEGHLIDIIQLAAAHQVDFIIFNPAAYTHTSIALRDAIKASAIPFIELHLSNIYAREAFRATSYFSDIAQGVITGLGDAGYDIALLAACRYLETPVITD